MVITTSRLQRHEFDLLPPETGELLSLIMDFFKNNSILEESTLAFDSPALQEMDFTQLFNFSMKEAMAIIVDHQRKMDQVFSPEVELALIVVYAIIITCGLITNGLLCFIVIRQCTRKSITNNGPSPRNLYIVNLAVADLLLCIVCMPFTLFSLLKRKWTLGLMMCKLVPIIQGANVMVSSGTIMAIAFDR